MSILSDFKLQLENTSPLNVYVEYDETPLSLRGDSFVTVGIASEECAYDVRDSLGDFAKDRIAFRVTVLMRSDTDTDTISNYFDTYVLNPLMKSEGYNVTSTTKGTPNYTNQFDRMVLTSTIVVECIGTFE